MPRILKIQRVVLIGLVTTLSACGDLAEKVGLGDDDDKKNTNNGVIFQMMFDPGEFYTFAGSSCGANERNSTKRSFNRAGEILREEVCAFDPASRLQTSSTKRRSYNPSSNTLDELKERDYTEAKFNTAMRIESVSEWEDSTKTKLTSEATFTYDANGKLVSAVSARNSGSRKYVTTYTFDAAEYPASEKEEEFKDGVIEDVRETTCNLIGGIFGPTACETKENGVVNQKTFLEGADLVTQELKGANFVEVERERRLAADNFLPALRVRRSFEFSAPFDLRYETTETCADEGAQISCTEERKNPAGKIASTETVKQRFAGTSVITVGSRSFAFRAYTEFEGSFSNLKPTTTLTGTFTGTFDPATLNRDDRMVAKFVKDATNDADLGGVFVSPPFWGEIPSLDDLWTDDFPGGDVAVRVTSSHDAEKREILWQIVEATGIPENQTAANEEFKRESVYR